MYYANKKLNSNIRVGGPLCVCLSVNTDSRHIHQVHANHLLSFFSISVWTCSGTLAAIIVFCQSLDYVKPMSSKAFQWCVEGNTPLFDIVTP